MTSTGNPTKGTRRKRLALAVLGPLLLLGTLEMTLRFGRYGVPPSFFIQNKDGSYSPNRNFGRPYFPAALARTPVDARIPTPKAAGEFRIVILGSSAAMGDPDPSYSLGRILERMLTRSVTGRTFRVINAAMTAINSHVVRRIARDCEVVQPDLFIVYCGNNEVIGPYGPATRFVQGGGNLWVIRLGEWARKLRTGQFLDNMIGPLRAEPRSASEWQGIDMFAGNMIAADDPRLHTVEANFEINLRELIARAETRDIPVILCSVPVNLAHFPPLASTQAVASFQAGSAAWATGAHADAWRLWREARDLDEFRVRAGSGINRTLARLASETDVAMVDFERVLEEATVRRLEEAGDPLFHDHVHLSFEGNYLVASQLYGRVSGMFASTAGVVPSQEQCKTSLAYTTWDERRILSGVYDTRSQPPFDRQHDHDAGLAALRKRIRGIQIDPAACMTVYTNACAKFPDDWMLHRNLALFHDGMGRPGDAVAQWKQVLASIPNQAESHERCGMALVSIGAEDEGIHHLAEAIRLRPFNPYGYANLAAAYLAAGRAEDALPLCEKAVALEPADAVLHSRLAAAWLLAGNATEATNRYLHALHLAPSNPIIHNNFAVFLLQGGCADAAELQWHEAVRLDPDFHEARLSFANRLLQSGRLEEAMEHYRYILDRVPEPRAANNLGIICKRLGRLDEALAWFETAITLDATYLKARLNRAEFLENTGQWVEAGREYAAILAIDPQHAGAREGIGRVRGRH